MKKIISMLIAAIMILAAMPLAALAADADADGYNDYDAAKISAFLKLSEGGATNAERLGYDSDEDPAAWADVVWGVVGDEKRVTDINWGDMYLAGSLDLSGCEYIDSLSCNNGYLESLNVSGCTRLEDLDCYDNMLTSLNLTGCSALCTMNCRYNFLDTLDVSSCTNLKSLDCSNNAFSSLDIGACTNLALFECMGNPLGYIHFALNGVEETFTAGEIAPDMPGGFLDIYCGKSNFYAIARTVFLPFSKWIETAGGADHSAHLILNLDKDTSYDLTAGFASNTTYNDHDLIVLQTFLGTINAEVTNAGSLDYDDSDPSAWSGVTWDGSTTGKRVTNIDLHEQNIAGVLDLSGCTSLVSLNCDKTSLSELYITGCTALSSLSCSGNSLEFISADISGMEQNVTAVGGNIGMTLNTGVLTATNAGSMPFRGWMGARNGLPFSSDSATVTLETGIEWNIAALFGYAVLYDGNGATEGMPPNSYFERYAGGETAYISRNTGVLKRAGYRLTGWNTAANGSGTSYKADGTGELIMPVQDVTLYAEWRRIVYHISYDLGGGAVSGNPTLYSIEDPSFTLFNPTRAGYTFTGWTWEGHSKPETTVTISQGSIGDKAYKANWALNAFTVMFDAQGGSAVGSMSRNQGDAIASAPATVRTGYNFTGWYADAGCTVRIQFPFVVTANVTMYAGWAQQPQGNYLANAIPSCGSLNRAFDPKVTSYKITIGENDVSFTLTPIKQFDGATMTINKANQSSCTVYPANGKSAKITVKVTYAKKTKTYTFTVTRAKSSNNALASLSATAGTFSQPFDPNVMGYTLTLPEDTKSTTIKAVSAAGKLASVSPSSSKVTLNNGQSKTVKITVKAQSGSKRMYTITVVRAASTDANLKSLKAPGLSPGFSMGITAYSIVLPANKSSVTVSAKAAGYKATVSVDGSGKSSKKIALANGEAKTVPIVVTSQAGGVKTYIITVTRQ